MKELTDSIKSTVIAVDGVSASGKGSVSKLISKKFNLVYLETGLLYRAVGYFVLKENLSTTQINKIVVIANNIKLNDLQTLNLHNETIAKAATSVAKIKEVREALLLKQRNFANHPPADKSGAILDGRDIGTIICPNADIKFFLTANLEIRAQRRFDQLKKSNPKITLEEISNAIKARDESDKMLNDLALNSKDYIVIDNSKLSLQETFILLKSYIITRLKL